MFRLCGKSSSSQQSKNNKKVSKESSQNKQKNDFDVKDNSNSENQLINKIEIEKKEGEGIMSTNSKSKSVKSSPGRLWASKHEDDHGIDQDDDSLGNVDYHRNAPTMDDLREETVGALKVEKWHCQGLSVVVFGASGDLAKKKTYPSLFALYKSNSLSEHTIICGYARSQSSDESFRKHLRPYLLKNAGEEFAPQIDEFLKLCIYRAGPYDSLSTGEKISTELKSLLKKTNCEGDNRVFYFALPPSAFVATAKTVKESMLSDQGYNRVVIEKPFGHDTESARKLGRELGALLDESMMYRIDHYLGKEMVQNLIVLRFGNTFLEPLWNRQYVSAVQITFKEDIGTMGRGGYFDQSGIIRDVMQNHLIQVLSIVAMERPVRVAGEDYSDYVRDEKVKVLKCIKPIKLQDVVLGQYIANESLNQPGYRDDETVPNDSTTPTFCTAVFYINNPRWEGVPFIMKAGKALDNRRAEIRVQLKPPVGSNDLFSGEPAPQNEFVIRLQPKEAIYMKTNVKRPGLHTTPIQSELDLTYESRYPIEELHDAYTRLLLDVFRGKQATFVRNDELIAAWEIFTPLLKEIEEKKIKPIEYLFGSRGPEESDQLVRKVGFTRNEDYKKQWEKAQEEKKAALTANM